jgi:hypothetical protein
LELFIGFELNAHAGHETVKATHMPRMPRRYTSLTVAKKPVSEIRQWLSANYWKFPSGLFFSSLYVWIPIQLVNLYWVPLPFRVLYMNVSVMVSMHRHPPSVKFACQSDRSIAEPRLQIWTVYLATKLSNKSAKKA